MMMILLLPLIIIQHSTPGGFLGQELYSTHWINATSNGQRACENFTAWLKTVGWYRLKLFYPQCYWIAGILQVEKGSFCEHVRHKTKHLAKWEAGEQTGPIGLGSRSAVPGPAFYASWIPFELAIKKAKRKRAVLYPSCLPRSPAKARQNFRTQISRVGGSSSYFMSSGAATASAPCSNRGIQNANL